MAWTEVIRPDAGEGPASISADAGSGPGSDTGGDVGMSGRTPRPWLERDPLLGPQGVVPAPEVDDPVDVDLSEHFDDDDLVTQGLVDRLEGGVATILIGHRLEEWVFPAHLLPPDARESTVLRLRWDGHTYEVLDVDPSVKPLEERLERGLNRKRPISFPLPRRAHPQPPPHLAFDERVSRIHRTLRR